MNLKFLTAGIAACLLIYTYASKAGETVLPDADILKSTIVVDCGQWPPENDDELAKNFMSNCQKNSKLIGYAQAWALTMENVPKEALQNPKSFNCPPVAKPNIGYACLGLR